MFNGSNCDRKSQLSGILTEPLNPRVVYTCKVANYKNIPKIFFSILAKYDWKMYKQEENEEQEI